MGTESAGTQERRDVALRCYRAAVAAADPAAAVRVHLQREGEMLLAGDTRYDLAHFRRVLVVGAGKAGVPMATELERILGDRLDAGLVIVKEGHGGPLRHVQVREAAHPVPDAAGVAATRDLLALVATAGPEDLLICLLSGGGSALLVAPAAPLTLVDKQALTSALLRAGCTINEINAVRKHCSAVKGGQLARAANGATFITLLLSDVIGDAVDVIASGPTVPDASTFAEALAVIERYGLSEQIPPPVLERLRAGRRGEIGETPKAGDPCFARARAHVIAGLEQACLAAQRAAEQEGYVTLRYSTTMQGEARDVAALLLAEARRAAQRYSRPFCLLAGGETTVTVRGDGTGGRNQELALAAALLLEGQADISLAALATDGGDGPTDAAGAIVDGDTVRRAAAQGLQARAALERNDAYPLLDAAGALIRTGPSGTNVNDLFLVLVS
jgi:hydroxypyruvate reductase